MTVAADLLDPLPQHLVLDEVSWDFYERLLAELDSRPIRVTFDNGALEIMSPLPAHEKWKKRIDWLIELLAVERNVSIEPFGSTTFRRRDLGKGLEPDECYFIRHAADVRGRDEWDPAVHPPPDLAIEIDITRRSIPRQPIYAALGVPEVWRFTTRRLTILLLGRDGKYAPSAASLAFPFLPMAGFETFLRRLATEEPTAVLREFRDWVKGLK